MFKRSKEQEKKGSEKREVLLVSFWNVARFVFAIINLRKEFNELKRGIIKCRDYIFNFLENPDIPSDNNASERGIRKLKVKQKISGCFRSDTGADAFHALHSIADTAWKNGQSPLDAILALV